MSTAANNLNAIVYWIRQNERRKRHQQFRVGERIVLLDYTKLLLTDPPLLMDNILYFSDSFIKAAEELFSTQSNDVNFRVGAILIDPGHGGKDPGAVASHTIGGKKITIQEKDIDLLRT